MKIDKALHTAFQAVLDDIRVPDRKEYELPPIWYVVLVRSYQAYGGPEEGGWWHNVHEIEAYQEFDSARKAVEAETAIKKLASQMTEDARLAHGKAMSDSVAWLEARGLDADFLPEPDSAFTYSVKVTEGCLPSYNNSRPAWE